VIDALRKLYDHLRWADSTTFASLQAQPKVPAVVLERFMHVLGAEHIWLVRIFGEPARAKVWPEYTVSLCSLLQAENHAAFAALLRDADDTTLRREIAYTNSAGQSFRTPLADILLHVALHGAWHRGQVATLMRQAGLEPAPTDYIAFVRGVPAAVQR